MQQTMSTALGLGSCKAYSPDPLQGTEDYNMANEFETRHRQAESSGRQQHVATRTVVTAWQEVHDMTST